MFKERYKMRISRTIIDKKTKETLPGAHVFKVENGKETLIASSDLNGKVNLDGISRDTDVKVTFIGYKDLHQKAGALAYEMQEDSQSVGEVVVIGKKSKPKPKNYTPFIVAGVLLVISLIIWKKKAILQFFGR